MYGIGNDVDLSFMLESSLIQLCIGENEIILNFDKDIKITILSSAEYTSFRGIKSVIDSASTAASCFVNLLSKKISTVEARNNDCLRIVFDSGDIVEVFDDSKEFESFWIEGSGVKIIV